MHRDNFALFHLIMWRSRCLFSTIAVVGQSGGICCTYSAPSAVMLLLSWIVLYSPVTLRYFYSKHGLFLLLGMTLNSIITSNLNLLYAVNSSIFYEMVTRRMWLVHIVMCLTSVRPRSKMFPNKMPANKTRYYPNIRTEKILLLWPIKSCIPPESCGTAQGVESMYLDSPAGGTREVSGCLVAGSLYRCDVICFDLHVPHRQPSGTLPAHVGAIILRWKSAYTYKALPCVIRRSALYQSASWPVCLCTVLVLSCTEWRVIFRLTFSPSVASARDDNV